MTSKSNNPEPNKPSYCMPPLERLAMAKILHERLTEIAKGSRHESYHRFKERINKLSEGRLSPSTIDRFMMRDNTYRSTYEKLATAFEFENWDELEKEIEQRTYGEQQSDQQLRLFDEES